MSRLNCMQDHELAIQSIGEQLTFLERYVTSGHRFRIDELNDLTESLMRLADILRKGEPLEQSSWETDKEPLPPWLRPRQHDADEILERVAEKVV